MPRNPKILHPYLAPSMSPTLFAQRQEDIINASRLLDSQRITQEGGHGEPQLGLEIELREGPRNNKLLCIARPDGGYIAAYLVVFGS
jgi:hypothetical protein